MMNFAKKNKSTKEKNSENKTIVAFHEEQPKIRMVGLYGAVDEEKSAELIYNMMVMKELGRQVKIPKNTSEEELENLDLSQFPFEYEPFGVLINTGGGIATDMFAIVDTMEHIKKECEIYTIGVGHVMSAGIPILAAGTRGRRQIGRNTRVMIHSVIAGHHGSLEVLETELEEAKWTQDRYIDLLVKYTNLTDKRIRKLIKNKVNVYMDAAEAVKIGIADEII